MLADFTVSWLHDYRPVLCHVPPGPERDRFDPQVKGGVWRTLTVGNPSTLSQADGPALMFRQQTVGHVITEMCLGWRWMRTWQVVDPRWREMSAASCHIVFVELWKIQNCKAAALGQSSLTHQLWSDSLRQTCSLAALSHSLIFRWWFIPLFAFCMFLFTFTWSNERSLSDSEECW